MKLSVINTGLFKLDGGAMFGVVPKSIWQRFNPADENNMCTWAMRCLLIEEGDQKILIDTGIGTKQEDKFFNYFSLHGNESLTSSLSNLSLSPTDITDVILTHMHFDHVGGAVTKSSEGELIPQFPNATYWTNEQHLATALKPNVREKASFLKENITPLIDNNCFSFIKKGETPFEFIDFHWVSGHTTAQMLPIINYKGKKLAFTADLIPSYGHIPIPYVMAYDMQPLLTLKEKDDFLSYAIDNDITLFLEHDPVNECCSLHKTEKGIRHKALFPLNDWL